MEHPAHSVDGGEVRRAFANRVDATAKELTAYAKSIGLEFDPIGGKLDGFLWLGKQVRLVDFKSPGGTLTEAQGKLLARGCPVVFISTPTQLDALKAEMLRAA